MCPVCLERINVVFPWRLKAVSHSHNKYLAFFQAVQAVFYKGDARKSFCVSRYYLRYLTICRHSWIEDKKNPVPDCVSYRHHQYFLTFVNIITWTFCYVIRQTLWRTDLLEDLLYIWLQKSAPSNVRIMDCFMWLKSFQSSRDK